MFKRRLFQEMKTTYQYWRSLVDWITLIYMTVPTAIFGYYFLRETVFQTEYGVLEILPSYIVVSALVIIAGIMRNVILLILLIDYSLYSIKRNFIS